MTNPNESGEGGAANTPPFPRRSRAADESAGPLGDEPTRDRDHPLEAGRDHPLDSADRPDPRPAGSYSAAEPDDEEGPPLHDLRPPPEPIGRRAVREFRSQADRSLQRGFSRIADHLDEVAARVNRVSADRLAAVPGAARAESTAAWMEEAADYLRSSDLSAVQADLADHVRRKPLQSLLMAVGAGWILGRIMR
jgi:hypothetical protein